MTKDNFASLCDQVLVPRIGDLLRRELLERDDMLEILARQLARIEKQLSSIETSVFPDSDCAN